MRTLRARLQHSVPRGFSLVELMIVVAIIGLLASMAIPAFQGFMLRTKRSERTNLSRALSLSVEDYIATRDMVDFITAPNPPGVVSGNKREFDRGALIWKDLAFDIDAPVYYQYYVHGFALGPTRFFHVHAYGDIDADNAVSERVMEFEFLNDRWQMNYDQELGDDN